MNWRQHQLVALDTNCFIYLMEASLYQPAVRSLFAAIEAGHTSSVSSMITVTELLTGPAQRNDYRIWEEFRTAIYRFPNLRFRPIDATIAEKASLLRAQYRLKTPDALHLATAIVEGADLLITNDKELAKCDFPILLLSELTPS